MVHPIFRIPYIQVNLNSGTPYIQDNLYLGHPLFRTPYCIYSGHHIFSTVHPIFRTNYVRNTQYSGQPIFGTPFIQDDLYSRHPRFGTTYIRPIFETPYIKDALYSGPPIHIQDDQSKIKKLTLHFSSFSRVFIGRQRTMTLTASPIVTRSDQPAEPPDLFWRQIRI